MSKNLLAVDDSATMRRVLEITFSGEDFNVISAGDQAGALAKLGENPAVVVIDTMLGDEDGYALCKEVRSRSPHAAIVLLSSRYNPYDQAKGRDAGADEYMDKPFDTQQLIDKVRKVLISKEGAAAAAPPPAASPAPPIATAPSPQPAPVAARPAPPPPAAPQPPKFQPGPMPQRSGTLMFSVDGPPVPAPGSQNTAETAAPPPPPVAARPAPPPPAPAAPKPAPAAAPAPGAAAAAQVNGQLGPKLAEMGLTPAQVEGVLALSREVVEQVVWEVVPQLAETIIKEEIARLTK